MNTSVDHPTEPLPYIDNEVDRLSRSIAAVTGMPGKHRAIDRSQGHQRRPATSYKPRHDETAS